MLRLWREVLCAICIKTAMMQGHDIHTLEQNVSECYSVSDLMGGYQRGRIWAVRRVRLYILLISNIISGWVLTRDSPHLWPLYNAAPLGNQFIITITQYSTESYYPGPEQYVPYHINVGRQTRTPVVTSITVVLVISLTQPRFVPATPHLRSQPEDLPIRPLHSANLKRSSQKWYRCTYIS